MIIVDDMRAALAEIEAASVDAIVTDPPYELSFMGAKWDDSGIAFDVDAWRAVLRVLKPGAHLVAFGGTRRWHRMVSAIEDAGFEIRDSIAWLFGTGFPKNRASLKPGHEPICLARKPLDGTVAANVAEHGTGALNIDATRLGDSKSVPGSCRQGNVNPASYGFGAQTSEMSGHRADVGRWPPNVALSDEAASDLHEQAGSASRFFYCPKASTAEREAGLAGLPHERGRANLHPTVKPIELMRWLVRLVVPQGGLVLDPFAGSGSTGVAARLEGRRFVGIEQETPHACLAWHRIENAAPAQPTLFED